MLTRLTHAAIAFAVTAVLYQAYLLAVVPFVEPPPSAAFVAEETAKHDFEDAAGALDKHRELLSTYFPPTHWCFARPPITIGNGQLLIVVDQYKQSDDGKLEAPRCAVIFFQKPFDGGGPAPKDAIILEPSQGASLQLEQALGNGVNGLGRIQFGELKGDVTVRSEMSAPGAQDDLLIKTRDIYMNEDLVRTDQPVDMKLGNHHGYGRELEIRMLKTENPAGGGGGLYGRFEDLVIKRDVMVSFTPSQSSLPGSTPGADGQAAAIPPVRIQSAGPFRVDFGSYKATFEDQVRAWQIHPDGKKDELLAAKLTMFFAKTSQWNSGGVTPTVATTTPSLSFEPASLEAVGTPEAPVLLKAPSQDAMAMGRVLQIELANRKIFRIILQDDQEAVLRHQSAEIHARTLRYQMPPEGSGQRLGTMSARSGGGWLRAIVSPERPNEILEVSWKDAMQLIRRPDGQPVLVLDGRPKVSHAGRTLWADRLQVFLREQTPAAGNAPSSLSSTVSPERITATGRVGIESAELNGKVNELDIRIAQASAGGVPDAPAAPGAVGNSGAPPPSPFDLGGSGPQRSYNIAGVTLQMDVVIRDKRPDVRAIRVDNNVVFEESAAAGAAEPPLRIVAEHLQVTGADTPNAQIQIIGGGGQNGAPLKDAEITAGGAEIRAPSLTINRASSKAQINSPGKLKLLVDRDLTGNPLPAPAPMWIDWQESMTLEGRRITFLGDVYVRNDTSGWLRTRRLVAQTDRDIRFDGAGGQARPQLEQLECWEGAEAKFEQQDISGVVARHHIELQSLKANQINGLIEGAGPGFIDSTHFAKNSASLLTLPGSSDRPAAPELVNEEPELRHLHIDFVRSVDGNLLRKKIAVHGDVQAVYGPVKSWDEKLAMSPGGDPEPGVLWITSESLGITESVMAQLTDLKTRQFELEAMGRVAIEGQHPEQGMFTAYGDRASYDQSKGLFVLEGNPATIDRQQFPGAPSSPQTAQRMTFNQVTGTIRVDGLQQGKINQYDLGRQPLAPVPR